MPTEEVNSALTTLDIDSLFLHSSRKGKQGRKQASYRPSAGIARIRFKGSMASEAILSAGFIPAPRRSEIRKTAYLSASRRSFSFFEEITWPVRPAGLL